MTNINMPIKNASAPFLICINQAPAAGPKILAVLKVMAERPTALGKASRPTRTGINARRMGVCQDVAAPSAKAKLINTLRPKRSISIATPPARAMSACTDIEAMSPWRGLIRSEIMPNSGESTKTGPSIRAAVTPTQLAECVISQALHPSRKRTIQEPRLENQLAGK
jgi:hypothetical protein